MKRSIHPLALFLLGVLAGSLFGVRSWARSHAGVFEGTAPSWCHVLVCALGFGVIAVLAAGSKLSERRNRERSDNPSRLVFWVIVTLVLCVWIWVTEYR